ncbi:MAG: phosphatase PAP2 family protein, partial [Phycisphaerae bacterium]|nr:phosphatase PAP2 family protein [Phycisphaerae bacterium]NIP53151.1 phosphatase PAP2 family protein [Phycisphaerae bacterium]NIS50905.1 phosphatase PAP2 family protein [Phycisphaerae bacterium]NIU07524.1 phosphatase PAP2 family protein [Phycisphaerae bacterium]NIU55114.1 phosphatase PAP2 family protein [Phycisphaerae bacterium]
MRHVKETVVAGVVILVMFVIAGCGTMENGRGWGEDLVLRYEPKRLGKVVHDAFFDWQTIGPLLGAAVFAVDDFDEKASDWATKHTPIFGSVEDAKDASDDLRRILRIEALATVILTPSGDESDQWAASKARGAGVEVGAYLLTDGLTNGLKDWTDRQRPDESGDNSFPSGHSSQSFAFATLSNRNLDYIDVPWGLRRPLQVTNIALASGVAWARVEGQRHYPSDVLFGAALGHFATRIVHDYFLDLPEDDRFDLRIRVSDRGAMLETAFAF